MKLYHLNPNNWGEEFYVMSDSPENAFKAIQDHFKKRMEYEAEQCKDSSFKLSYYKDLWEFWSSCSLDKLPKKYKLEEHDINKVVESEVA